MALPDPPVAPIDAHQRVLHGEAFDDPYAWMLDRHDPRLRELLSAENTYTDECMASSAHLVEELFNEIRGRIQETDLSVPWKRGDWWYQSRTIEGRSYPIHVRRADDGSGTGPHPSAAEQVLLDENAIAEGHEYSRVGAASVSPDGSLLAWAVDHDGDEAHLLRVRELSTSLDAPPVSEIASYSIAWAADSRTLFYATLDAAQRPWQIWRHRVDQPDLDDELVFEEPDERFFVHVDASRCGRWIVISSASAITSEAHLIPAASPTTAPRLVMARRQGVEYYVETHLDDLFVLTNADGADDFALFQTSALAPDDTTWTTVIEHQPGVRLDGVDALRDHLVIHLRRDGTTALTVIDLAGGGRRDLDLPEDVGTVAPGVNEEFDTSTYRFSYQSLVTPNSIFDENLATGQRTLRKQQPVLGGYSPHDFETRRMWADADDGTPIPITVVHRRGLPHDGSAPCLLYGYGAYEMSTDPWFSPARLSLLERGWVWAIAHVRGGGELGHDWYTAGKLLAKPNSFTDFVTCARHLVLSGLTSPDRLVARGGSAGGLLMGAVANLEPGLFRAVIAEVPFVDPLNTLLDAALPLTVTEWEEWGNPAEDRDVYECIKGYSPYENVRADAYPAILVTAGLEDPRVGVHEPAKWVQMLRSTTTGKRPILLRTEMGAGHAGPSGRYDAWREEAFVLAFALVSLDEW